MYTRHSGGRRSLHLPLSARGALTSLRRSRFTSSRPQTVVSRHAARSGGLLDDNDTALSQDEDAEDTTEEGDEWSDLGRIQSTALLSAAEVAERMYVVHKNAAAFYKSFYSSVYGGIVTDPALFLLPIDDHMVHRGHGVYDTAVMIKGYIYQLDEHLERFLMSAEAAQIPIAGSVDYLRRIILDTAAASFLRFWMSAGRGGFSLSGHDTIGPEFYCVCYNGPYPDMDETLGWKVKTSEVPNKHPYFAELKSVNYLPNALNLMDAQDSGMNFGIFLHEDGTVCGGPDLNLGIITEESVVKIAPFAGCMAGCTMSRLLELAPSLAAEGELEDIVGVVQAPITLKEALSAREVFVTGGALPVASITEWDGRRIGDGKVGIGALVLRQVIINDMFQTEQGNDQLTPVPYGILTGMIEDL